MESGQVVTVLKAKQMNVAIFRQLATCLAAARATMQQPELRPLAAALLPAVNHAVNGDLELDSLGEACGHVSRPSLHLAHAPGHTMRIDMPQSAMRTCMYMCMQQASQ